MAVDRLDSVGAARRSSTEWFAVHDDSGESVGGVVFGSSFRAQEWACEKFGKSWSELHALGFTVQGGASAAETEVK